MSQKICGRCSVPGTGTILWSRHGASGRGSAPNGAGTTGASAGRGEDASYKAYFTYLNYDHRIQSMIYTTNWIERLQKDFRRVTRMRGAMPNEESVILLMGKTAMDKKSYLRQVPRIDLDKDLFPDE